MMVAVVTVLLPGCGPEALHGFYYLHPVFGGEPPYTGFGLLNDADITINNTYVSAEKTQEINEDFNGNDRKGHASYIFEGKYDTSTYDLTGTITIYREDKVYGANGQLVTTDTVEYKGTLTAKGVDSTCSSFEGSATGTQNIKQVFHYGEGPGVRPDETEEKTKEYTWTFKATGFRK